MTIYTMKHDTIHFSSTNPRQVEHYEKILDGVTLDDVKANSIEGRHALMVNAGLAGDFPLFLEYMGARETAYKASKALKASFDKYATTCIYNGVRMFINDAAELHGKEAALSKGWAL